MTRKNVVLAIVAALILAGATVSVLVFTPRPDDTLPVVRLLDAAPTLAVADARSTALRGVVMNGSPIAELRVNGRRLAAEFAADRMAAEFSGWVDASDLRRDGSIEVEVLALNGGRAVRRFPARRVAPATDGPGAAPRFEDVAGGDRRQRWAVVIGAGSFADPGIAPRPDAERDARAIAGFLRSPAAGLGGLPDSHVRLLVGDDATARNVRSALTTFLRATTPDDLVLVFLAGRSLPDPLRPEPLYLLTADTELDDIPATAVTLDFVRRAIADVYAANRVVLVDAGDALDRGLVDGAHARHGGLAVLAASGDRRLAPTVLAALRGEGDADRDGVVRLGELAAFAGVAIAPTSHDRHWPLGVVVAGVVAEP